MRKIFTAILLSMLFCTVSSAADRDSVRLFDRYRFISKGSFQFGTSLSHSGFSSANSELFLVLNGLDLSGNITRLSPYISYAYAKDRAVGLSFSYASADINIDAASLDLLNEGLSFDIEDLNASYHSSGVCLFHRWFFGLDPLSRFGIYYDTRLSYTVGSTEFSSGDADGRHNSNVRYGFDFTPGLMVFVRDNISCHLGVSLADVSYHSATAYKGGEVTGTRERFVSRIKLDPLGIVFGMSILL